MLNFYVNQNNVACCSFVNQQGKPSAPPPLYLGDVVQARVHSVDSFGVASSSFNTDKQYAFNLRPKSQLAFDSYRVEYMGELSKDIPFDASPVMVADAINEMLSITNAGGVFVEKNGAIYKVIFKKTGVRPVLNFVCSNGQKPPSMVLIEGTSSVASEQLYLTRFGVLATTTNFAVAESLSELNFKLNLNTFECALSVGSALSREIVCELVEYADGVRQTLAQSTTTLFNRVIDFDSFGYATNEILAPVERAEAAAQRAETALRVITEKESFSAVRVAIRNGNANEYAYLIFEKDDDGEIYPVYLKADEYENV